MNGSATVDACMNGRFGHFSLFFVVGNCLYDGAGTEVCL
jgi:hypothetical protein